MDALLIFISMFIIAAAGANVKRSGGRTEIVLSH